MVPDGFPGVVQDMAQGVVVTLAGDDHPIRLDAHVVEGGGAGLDPQFQLQGGEGAITGGGVPDQAQAVAVGRFPHLLQEGGQFALREAAIHPGAPAGIDEAVAGKGGNAQGGDPGHRLDDAGDVLPGQGGVGGGVEAGRHGVADALHRLRPGPPRPDHAVMDRRVVRFQGDLDVVQAGGDQFVHIGPVGQPTPVGEEAAHQPPLTGIGDQFDQVRPQRGLPAGEADVGDAHLPDPLQHRLPGSGIHLRVIRRAGHVAMGADVVATVGQGQVHAVGSAQGEGEGVHPLQFQPGDGATAFFGVEEGFQLLAHPAVVGPHRVGGHPVAPPHPAHGLGLGDPLQNQAEVLGRRPVQVEHAGGVDQEEATSVRLQPQMQAHPSAGPVVALVGVQAGAKIIPPEHRLLHRPFLRRRKRQPPAVVLLPVGEGKIPPGRAHPEGRAGRLPPFGQDLLHGHFLPPPEEGQGPLGVGAAGVTAHRHFFHSAPLLHAGSRRWATVLRGRCGRACAGRGWPRGCGGCRRSR